MIIEFKDGKMFVKHSLTQITVYTQDEVKQLKAKLEQELLDLKIDIARHQVYLDSMSETKPSLLTRVVAKLRKKA